MDIEEAEYQVLAKLIADGTDRLIDSLDIDRGVRLRPGDSSQG